MTDWLGPLQAVTIAGSLWLILVFPLAAAFFCAWAALARRSDERMHHAIGVVSIGAMALAFVASAWHAVALVAMPAPERFLLQHVFRMVRVGQLDASFDLALDPLSSTMTLVVTGVGALIFVYSATYMEDDASYARFFAWLNLFVFAMLVLVLADNLLAMFFGWEGVGLCSWGLIGFWFDDRANARAGAKAFLVNRIGDAGFLLGIAVLFWGLGGAWEEGEYAPDLEARFASVTVVSSAEDLDESLTAPEDPHALEGHALLTMTSYSGAVVYMDDARRPIERASGEPLRAPFSRVPVPAGVHTFRVHPGAGLDDALVSRVAMKKDREVAIAAVGPSLVFRSIRDELGLRDSTGRASFMAGLLSKHAAGKMGVVTLACLLLFLGAVGKSAQVPLHVWLPDAMAGPTPVSALIHAATMVTAGVYMIARLGFLFALSPVASTVVACTGAFTAIVAAAVGAYQYDLKRILAFSTISQLGLMIVGVGVGAYAAAIFHLVTHAFMKACLFLSASSVFGAMGMVGHEDEATQDVRHMGGFAHALPRTARAYRIACIAITATPIPGLAGFWSKDDIMVHAFGAHGLVVPGPALGVVMIAVSGVTSFYVWRSYYLAFAGPARPDAGKIHESSGPMTRVIEVLAGLSVIAGIVLGASTRFLGKGGRSVIERWLSSVLADAAAPSLAVEVGVIASAYVIALGGWALARSTYGESRAPTWEARERRSAMFGVLSHAFAFDAIYDAIFVRSARRLSEIATEVDRWVVDGAVNGVALAARVAAWIAGRADDAIVDGAVRAAAEGTLGAGARLRALQNGRIQTYVYIAISGLLALAALQYWLR